MIARRRETEIRNATRKRELIPRELVQKQAAFLVISQRSSTARAGNGDSLILVSVSL